MPRLDAFLAQLIQYEADALTVESGDNLYLVKGEERRPLMQARTGALTPAHVLALVADVARGPERAALLAGHPATLEYCFMDRTFTIEVAIAGDRYFARAFERIAVTVGRTVDGEGERAFGGGSGADRGDAERCFDDTAGPDALERAVAALVAAGGSDLHLSAGMPPMVRVDGEMRTLGDEPAIEGYGLQKLLERVLPPRLSRDLDRLPDCDAGIFVNGVRLRCSVFRDRGGLGAVFRVVARTPPSTRDIDMPDAFVEFCAGKRGLVLVSGVSGSGRSTTVAAMLDWINAHRALHIVTLESPIEIVHESKRSMVHQRDITEHAGGAARGLRAAAREDADVIYIADVSNREVLELALDLADAGRLVIVTIDATSPHSAIERLLDAFPHDRREHARTELAANLTGVIAPSLHARLGGGRVATFDVLVGSPPVADLIRANRIAELRAWPLSLEAQPVSPERQDAMTAAPLDSSHAPLPDLMGASRV